MFAISNCTRLKSTPIPHWRRSSPTFFTTSHGDALASSFKIISSTFTYKIVGLLENLCLKDIDEDNEYAMIREVKNDWKVPGHRGPNPPIGDHRYEFTMYALDDFINIGNKVGTQNSVSHEFIMYALDDFIDIGNRFGIQNLVSLNIN